MVYLMWRANKQIMTDTNTEVETLARTIWGEARGEGSQGMQAVANVIVNRVKAVSWYGANFEDVCKKPKQFSCWNADDPNFSKCMNVTNTDAQFRQCLEIAQLAILGQLEDVTSGANHYHTIGIVPSWARIEKQTCRIGNHIFYKL